MEDSSRQTFHKVAFWSGKPPFQKAFPKVGGGLGWSLKTQQVPGIPRVRLRKDLVSSPGWLPQPTKRKTPKDVTFDHFLICLANCNGSKIAGPPKVDLKIIWLMLGSVINLFPKLSALAVIFDIGQITLKPPELREDLSKLEFLIAKPVGPLVFLVMTSIQLWFVERKT